jgi:hypothetical protein
MSEAMKEASDGVVISLADDSLVDPAIAQVAATLWNEKDGRMCSAVQILVRPLDVRGDEAGGHPGEEFVMVTITRDELRAMLDFVEEDWRLTVQYAGDPNAEVSGTGTASAGLPSSAAAGSEKGN